MTYLVERLAELRRNVNDLKQVRPRAPDRAALERDMSSRNDVLFSLLMVCQLVIDIAGELSARRASRVEDDTEAIRNLSQDERFPRGLVEGLESLPGFRSVLIHEYERSTWIESWKLTTSSIRSKASSALLQPSKPRSKRSTGLSKR